MPGSVPHRVELGLTYRAAGKKKEASDQFEKARALPQSWVTDDHYRGLIPK
jgi:hypothetical protein